MTTYVATMERTEAMARQLHEFGPEAVALAMLSVSKRIAEQDAQLTQLENQSGHAQPSPSTPSGMVPIYTKPNVSKRRKKPGAREGHQGVRRVQPVKIDERKTHRLKCCPHCSGKLQRCQRSRTRIIEDIPEVIEPVVTEHTIHRDYCPNCKKDVEPIVPDAMPKAALGHQLIALTKGRRQFWATNRGPAAAGSARTPSTRLSNELVFQMLLPCRRWSLAERGGENRAPSY